MGEKFMLTIDDLRCQGPGSPLISKEAAKQVERLHLQRIANLESQVKSARQGKARAIEAIQARVRELEQEVERLKKRSDLVDCATGTLAAAETYVKPAPAERPAVQRRPTHKASDMPTTAEQPSGEREAEGPATEPNTTRKLWGFLCDIGVKLGALNAACMNSDEVKAAIDQRIEALRSAAKLVPLPDGAWVFVPDGEPRDVKRGECVPAASFGVPAGEGKCAKRAERTARDELS